MYDAWQIPWASARSPSRSLIWRRRANPSWLPARAACFSFLPTSILLRADEVIE
jgi:hypothetical protein